AFTDHPILGDTSGSVRVVNRKGQTITLSSGWKSLGGLAWSPTGEEVWFAAGMEGVNAIYARKLSGLERLVYKAHGNVGLQDISRDGRDLIFRCILSYGMDDYNAGST